MKTMKQIIILGLTVVAIGLAFPYCHGAETNKAPAVIELKKEPKLSVETLGVIRYNGITDGENYGAGLGVGYKFNKFVSGHIRAVSYQTGNWGGSAIDEGSALIEARLFASDNGGVTLSAIGGADREFERDDWGFSVGLRPKVKIYGPVYAGAEARIRAWMKGREDLSVGGFLGAEF